MALSDLPLVASDRKITGIQPRKVLHHFGKLIEDKEATEHVFHIIEAMKSKKSQKQAEEFILSKEGQGFIARDENIPEMLDNHENWADYPEFGWRALHRLYEARRD